MTSMVRNKYYGSKPLLASNIEYSKTKKEKEKKTTKKIP